MTTKHDELDRLRALVAEMEAERDEARAEVARLTEALRIQGAEADATIDRWVEIARAADELRQEYRDAVVTEGGRLREERDLWHRRALCERGDAEGGPEGWYFVYDELVGEACWQREFDALQIYTDPDDWAYDAMLAADERREVTR